MPKKPYRINTHDTASILIDSEEFSGLHYQIKDGHVILIGGECGTFAVDLKAANRLINELREVVEVYG